MQTNNTQEQEVESLIQLLRTLDEPKRIAHKEREEEAMLMAYYRKPANVFGTPLPIPTNFAGK
jgi:hypothetical protein